jgi:Secretory lipase
VKKLAVAMRWFKLCVSGKSHSADLHPDPANLAFLRGGKFRAILAFLTAAALLAASAVSAQVQAPSPGKRRALPITRFYDTPHPLPAGKPGELIRSEEFDQYEIPLSVDAVRILYHSRSATGEDVAASGVVLIPSGKNPPAGGWPIIAWAHGATGVSRSCAPSLTRNLGHAPFLSMYVNLGYAVVAPDYTGLGTDFRNAFLDGPSNATDLIASIPAARAAIPRLGTRWIVMGEAEGSLAAVAVAKKENEIRDPGYLGSVAISGLGDVREIYGHAADPLILASLAYGIKTVFPHFEVAEMLTEKGLVLYQRIGKDCAATGIAGLSSAEIAKRGWLDNAFVRQYFARNDPAEARAYGPMIVISGDADPAIPAAMTSLAITRMCKQGDLVQWQRYPLDSGEVIGASARDQMAWIAARFAGRQAITNCP